MSTNRHHAVVKAIATTVLAFSFFGADTRAAALEPQQVYALVSPSVWRVQTYDDEGLPLAMGSAIVMNVDTLVTNCHVLAKAKRVAVKQGKRSVEASLEMWDPERDICQIRAPDLGAPAVTLGEVGRLQIGQPVYAIGNPKGLDLTVSAGLLSSIRRNQQGQVLLLQTSAPISGGSSGGGLFDDQGALIGLTTLGSTGDAQNLNFAVPADWIKELPKRHAMQGKSAAPPIASVAGATNPAPAGVEKGRCVGAANWPAPRRPVDASMADPSRLPRATERMRDEFRTFLTCPLPRAFAISENGKWWYAWSTMPKGKSAPRDPIDRALRSCEKVSGSICFLYAVDDRIVYPPASE